MTDMQVGFSSKTRNNYLVVVGILMLFNIAVFNVFIPSGGYDSNNVFHKNSTNHLQTALMAFLVSFPLLSLLLGLLVAAFPYKGLSYGRRYLRSSLLSMISINGVIAILLFIVMALKLMKTSS